MVAPTRNKSPTKPTGKVCLLLLGLIAVTWISFSALLSPQMEDESSSLLLNSPQDKTLSSKYPQIDCDAFLNDIRRNSSNVHDTNNGTLFANYLTNYNPPFWISNPQFDRATVRTGVYSEDPYKHTQRLEEILNHELHQGSLNRNRLIFWQLSDRGWYPLFAGSKGNFQVAVVHTDISKSGWNPLTIRLCEALRLNQWTRRSTKRRLLQHTGHNAAMMTQSFQIYGQTPLPELFREEFHDEKILLLKLEGPNILEMLQQIVNTPNGMPRIQYLWIEWSQKQNDPQTILQFMGSSKQYTPWWPDNQQQYVQTSCVNSCSLWWKGT